MHVYGHSLPVAGLITGIGFPGVSWTFLHVYGHSLPVAGFITGIGFPGVSWTFLHVYGHSLPVAGFITGIGFSGVSWTFVDIHARLWSFITSCWIYHWNRFHGLSLIFMHVYGHSLPVAGLITGICFPGVSWTILHVCGNSLPVAGFITGIGFPGVSWSFLDIHASLWSFITSCWIYHWNRLSRGFMVLP